ncbi:EscI/YscI/HrpB family type III secretion system inner rod protein [Rugamonas rubra]|uniref:Type III secretion system major needle protein, YscF/MxiH/PrgI family n=1 Tax=Rugamonas rubra TaxID=758825 RepID=A0A1I4M4Q0_9BURK|nr:EscI/YscI/HrpB family type III secretion system inner rod protein [Rugamonas rubra]SFL98222.1 type III secretion system major needle protein, YscF/MxiH/PrgI family [Rugamonas rubra]
MTPIPSTAAPAASPRGAGAGGEHLTLEIQSTEPSDGARFSAALERQLQARGGVFGAAPPAGQPTLGERLAGRASGLAGDIRKEQQNVSKMLEKASQTGDSMQLMKAMMALSDYQVRVQTISKTVSKATQAFDQLTKLQ